MQLQRLTALERDKIQAEYDELQKKIAEYQEILASDKVLKKVIAERAEGNPESLRRRAAHGNHRAAG